MHPPLHTKDNIGCEEVMNALEECHARGFLYSVMGSCNKAKTALNLCLRGERLERTRENREKAAEKRRQVEALWKDIDQNS